MKQALITILILCNTSLLFAVDLDFYLGKEGEYNDAIPTPDKILGYQVGDWHVRHDQLVNYMRVLADASDRVKLEVIGYTHEQRPLLHLTISTPENLADIERLRVEHVNLALGKNGNPKDMPLVIQLGYGVHGNEPSGSNAALLVAWYLAAAKGIEDMLSKTIIILDPCLNPDGLSRFAQWANMHKGKVLVADRINREHSERYPSGRTNHYWFDLNRDWLLLQHPESRARVARFHQWRPNILTDHHEMGTNSTFFFQPGIPSRQNPKTPPENFDLTRLIATYHADAFNKRGVLYFSEQGFDDFYFGKGSTYPDIQGSIGILFEQASSRGHLQENFFGKLTFPDTIKNQIEMTMSTLKAGHENRDKLLTYQREFFPNTMELARKDKLKAYVFGSRTDPVRAYEMARVLDMHEIELYRLAKPITLASGRLEEGYVVPLEQGQYRLIQSIFEEITTFNDNTFYDVSAWHFPSLFWTTYGGLEGRAFTKDLLGERVENPVMPTYPAELDHGDYAYLVEWEHYYSARTAYTLLDKGLRLRYANRAFSAETASGEVEFSPGTLVVPTGIQELDKASIRNMLAELAERDGVRIHSVKTGLTPKGGDLGGSSFTNMRKPKVLLPAGVSTSAYRVGEIWHLLDERFRMPVTLADLDRIRSFDDYTHVILAGGSYSGFSKERVEDLKRWVRGGGTLIACRDAVNWVKNHKLMALTMVEGRKDKQTPERKAYADYRQDRAFQRIAGTLFAADLDLTHPLGYGLGNGRIATFRTNTLMVKPSASPYATVARYTDNPLISGYVSERNLEKIAGTAAVLADGMGSGAVIVMLDNPSFRGITYGTSRMLMNGLFFSNQIRSTRAVE
ncbi:MAG: M14 family zinc carboxypeptidase [Acidobacteriota bacterium]|nr:M14 family zinc carboxypeptidase [Acidobacteriota bacterium]